MDSNFDKAFASADRAAFATMADPEKTGIVYNNSLEAGIKVQVIEQPEDAGREYRDGGRQPTGEETFDVDRADDLRAAGLVPGWKFRYLEKMRRIQRVLWQGGTVTLICSANDGSSV